MNFGLGKFLDGPFNLETLERAFRRLVAAIIGGWEVQHREDGTHKDVTADTIAIGADPEDGSWDGNVGGSLVPTSSTQDLGATILKGTSVVADHPWRHLRLSGDITWATFQETAAATGSGQPVIDYDGTRSLAITCGVSGLTGTLTITCYENANVTVFSVDGLLGVRSDKNFTATTHVTAGTSLRGAELWLTDGVTAPGATAGQAKIYVDTSDGDLKVVFGDGTVKTIVTDT